MESKNLGYYLKNITIPSKTNYLKAYFSENIMMRDNNNYTNRSPPQNPA